MADLVSAFQVVCEKFQIETLNHHQKQALLAIVKEKKDVFLNLPTGFGKSLIYQALPLIFDEVSESVRGHIVVVVSPLLNLIQDQVNTLQKLGISAVSLSSVVEDEEDLENKIKYVENGRFSVVYATYPRGFDAKRKMATHVNKPIVLFKALCDCSRRSSCN